jgi:hypothetical protein
MVIVYHAPGLHQNLKEAGTNITFMLTASAVSRGRPQARLAPHGHFVTCQHVDMLARPLVPLVPLLLQQPNLSSASCALTRLNQGLAVQQAIIFVAIALHPLFRHSTSLIDKKSSH